MNSHRNRTELSHTQALGQSRSVGIAFSRLRVAVILCCWTVGIALALQVIVWSLVSYTDLRYENETPVTEKNEAPKVVNAESPREQRIRNARESDMGIDLSLQSESEGTDIRQLSRTDTVFAQTADTAGGIGRLAMLSLVPLMMVGVVLTAGSATPGVERVISSLVWALVATALILPFGSIGGGAFTMPWDYGALSPYEHMTGWLEQVQSSDQEQAASSLIFHLRFGLMPVTCIVGITLVGLRFCSGVEAGVLTAEDNRLDPVLEREAANISPSSLHSGRSSSAFSRALHEESNSPRDTGPSAKSVSPGETPQRLI